LRSTRLTAEFWSTSIDIGRDISEYWNGLVFTGSSNGYVLGVDVASGELRWATRLATNPKVGTYVGPISDGTLFVTLTDFLNFGQDQPLGGVAALDALTGDVKWLQMLPHDVNPDGPTATIDPVVAGDVVAAGSRDGPLYAYDRATGVLRWKAPSVPVGAADPMDVTDVRPLAACDGLIFAGSTSGILVALDPATGRERWRTRPAFWGTDGWVYCDERTVYAFYPYGQLEAFNSVDGSRRWEITDAPNHHFSVGGVADALFFYSGGLNGLYAIRK
jgi:outer membrane protein assembly factor BamB